MKLTAIAFVVAAIGLLTLVACNRKSAKNADQTPPAAAPPSTPEPNIPPPPPPAPEAFQVAGFQKTACFGKCPVYQVKFFSDGKVTWYGKMNVERMGWWEAKVDQATLKGIKTKADEVKYWDMSAEYPQGQKVADLPSTILYVRAGDVEKSVMDTHGAPEKLKEFERYLEDLISSLDWRSKG